MTESPLPHWQLNYLKRKEERKRAESISRDRTSIFIGWRKMRLGNEN
nr:MULTISPECIES: hypothetical protein [Anoxybacillus]